MGIDRAKIEKGIRLILKAIGEDPEREGLRETPQRVARMWEELLSEREEGLAKATKLFQVDIGDQLILIKDIHIIGICEHHLLPFMGKAHIAYLPGEGRIVGLNTIARWANSLAKRPQLQEQLTSDLAEKIMKEVNPRGVLVVIEAQHICMVIQGMKRIGSTCVTSAKQGPVDLTTEVWCLIKGLG
jgi:GTP cyclohydrolase IA